MAVPQNQTKTVLFFPLNSPGHVNSSLGIADRLKEDYGFRTIFLLLGSVMGNSIEENGHELIIMEEAQVLEDYEIEEGEDFCEQVDEELKRAQGKSKRKFPGAMKWPQLITRHEKIFKLDPVEAFGGSIAIMEKYMVAELIENHEKYAKTIESIKPDLIVIDAFYIPPCVVNQDIPWVKLHSANPLMIYKSKLPDGVKPPPMTGFSILTKEKRLALYREKPQEWEAILGKWREAMDRIIQSMTKAQGSLENFLKQHGCPALERGQQAHDSPYLNMYMYPKELDYDQEDDIFAPPPARWFRCDSLIRKSFDLSNAEETKFWCEKLADGMKDKSHLIFFSLGSIASGNVQLMKRYIRFFENDDQRLYVISKGVNGDKYQLNPGNMIGSNYVPQCLFLEQADLAIIHGGGNSITECMYYGIPCIVLPAFADQLDNAQRVEDLGLGRRLDIRNCTKEQIGQAIDETLKDRKLIERVREIGKIMRARCDSRKISKMIKKLIEDGKLEQGFIEECRNKNYEELEV